MSIRSWYHRIFAQDARIVLHDPELKEPDLPRLAIRPYPEQYVTSWILRNGTKITIRPIRPEDEPVMVKFHTTLSEQSVHFRYFGLLTVEQRTEHSRLAQICFNDYEREIAIVRGSPGFGIERRRDHCGCSTDQGPWGERGRVCTRCL
jgi:acetyltransferase